MGTALHVTYNVLNSTTKDCIAHQWLDKKWALLHSKSSSLTILTGKPRGKTVSVPLQSMPAYLHATLAHVQDTPSVKITAKVTSVLPVLPSAIRQSPQDLIEYRHHQLVHIPSYLIAIASGYVVYRPFPTSSIWAEPEMIDAAYWEVSEDTCKISRAEEDIVTSYRFGVYDPLILPPSFPYGGMASFPFGSPRLTSHSQENLNEGWTTYMERFLLASSMIWSCVRTDPSTNDWSSTLKKVKIQMKQRFLTKGRQPDTYLDRTIGGLDVFLPYVSDYVNMFMGKSITTNEWKAHLYAYYEKHGGPERIKAFDSIDWDAYSLAECGDALRATEVSKLGFKSKDLMNMISISVYLKDDDNLTFTLTLFHSSA
ncbi:hypothetical protein EDD85DRAFT_952572 [Armillaria nabsnona]|nr:hypothetical protein EDD85DRAFT_952572 [Armillaria nabsnona]